VELHPGACNFPYAATVVHIHSRQSKTSKWEDRYYLSSREATRAPLQEWGEWVRGHWSVENKTHWRKDATLGEDRTRTRKPWIMGNLILLRNLVLHFYEKEKDTYKWLSAWVESNQTNAASVVAMVTEEG
jgi:predicted transposase YbfD/YdcC